jgi:3-phenylpropionate/trans-cinnamate dioxygenase ferredoxin reductase component
MPTESSPGFAGFIEPQFKSPMDRPPAGISESPLLRRGWHANSAARAEDIVIVGAGHAAGELACALRTNRFDGNLLIIGDEPYLPYQRPALSKGFLAGDLSAEQLFIRSPASLEQSDIRVLSSTRVTSIDRMRKTLAMSDGTCIGYKRLVLATGGRPRRLALSDARLEDATNIHYLRTIDHVASMRPAFEKGRKLVIVGGGYIGLEVAAVARQKGVEVTLLEAMPRLLSRVTAPEMSEFYLRTHRAAGVTILLDTQVTGFSFGDTGRVTGVETAAGLTVPADLVLIGIGLIPNVELALGAGLAIDNGIAVDECGRTTDPQIFAVGDCCSHYSKYAGRRVRLESVPNAVEQARSVAAMLLGQVKPYESVPWFWSDQYKLKLQMVGLNDGHDSVVFRGSTLTHSFLAFYLRNGTLIAVDAVNRMKEFNICKKLVAARVRPHLGQLDDESVPLGELLDSKV